MRQGIQLLTILLCLQVARIVRNAGTHRGHRTRFRNAALHANGQITFFCLNFSRNWKFESRVATGVGDPCCDYLFIFVAAFVFVPDQIPVYLNTASGWPMLLFT